jgi:hypothetical protein
MNLRCLALALCASHAVAAFGAADLPVSAYHIYVGSTHAHTSNTWSHGEHFVSAKGKAKGKEGGGEGSLAVSPTGVQSPSAAQVLKPDWQKSQGPPAEHYALAKANGHDFYTVTDHSQEATFSPVSPTNPAWVAAKAQAQAATDAKFVALVGFEHSENNGPGGKGHLNVINSAEYINAMAPGIDLPHLYQWLKTVPANGEGPVVAVFNHPSAGQYNNWADRDPAVTEIITMLEVINSNTKIHYEAWVKALDMGWKVSPVCGNDNHGFWAIPRHTSRTFVLATSLTKGAVLEAMKNRRTYAALDKNIQCRYAVNDRIMGSTLDRPERFKFNISITDPDAADPKSKITKIEIVQDGGVVAQAHSPAPAATVEWNPELQNATNKYFFIRVWNAGGGDAAGADPGKPMAWLAPVWTGR